MEASRTIIVIMGVSGSGKSTVGTAVAHALDLPFLEADTFHSRQNVDKMRRGEPLDDADRAPWLDAIAAALADRPRYPRGVVLACSALKRRYRDRLRAAGPLRFAFLDVPPPILEQRVSQRHHAYMPASLLPSQLATLERPVAAERDALTIDAGDALPAVVAATLAALRD